MEHKMTPVSLTDIESLMSAAEKESFSLMDEGAEQVPELVPASVQPEPAQADQPVPTGADKIRAGLTNTNIATVLDRFASDPGEVTQMMKDSMGQISPDMMEEAKKMISNGQGQQILREMQRRGLNPMDLREQLMEHQRAMRVPKGTDGKRVVVITNNRQLRMRSVPADAVALGVHSILKSPTTKELSCSRLANGPLAGKTIKVWCDTENKGKNRRLSKIVGFPVGGDGVIVMEEGDLTEVHFLAAEKELV
jgi:hypothetical protein